MRLPIHRKHSIWNGTASGIAIKRNIIMIGHRKSIVVSDRAPAVPRRCKTRLICHKYSIWIGAAASKSGTPSTPANGDTAKTKNSKELHSSTGGE